MTWINLGPNCDNVLRDSLSGASSLIQAPPGGRLSNKRLLTPMYCGKHNLLQVLGSGLLLFIFFFFFKSRWEWMDYLQLASTSIQKSFHILERSSVPWQSILMCNSTSYFDRLTCLIIIQIKYQRLPCTGNMISPSSHIWKDYRT